MENTQNQYDIQFKNITKQYQNTTVLHPLNLNVPKGSTFALLGPNGSGKSTTINLAANLITPTSGTILIQNQPTHKNPTKIKQSTGILTEEPSLFHTLTIYEHLLLTGPIYNLSTKETQHRGKELLTLLDLWNHRNKNIDTASYGMKRKLSLAMALLHAPKTLLLDEPFKGLDPISTKTVHLLLKKLKQKGITLFLTTHLADKTEPLIDNFAIIHQGKILYQDTLKNHNPGALENIFFKYITPPPTPELQWLN